MTLLQVTVAPSILSVGFADLIAALQRGETPANLLDERESIAFTLAGEVLMQGRAMDDT
jgi:hypothetical protein